MSLVRTNSGMGGTIFETMWDSVTATYADIYSRLQYGKIPEPAKPVPIEPPPLVDGRVPPSFDMEAWWAQALADSRAATIAAQQEEIDRAVAAGTYHPEGKLPITAEGLGTYGPWILLAAGALVLILVLRRQ